MNEEPRFDHNSETTHEGQTRKDRLVRYQAEKRIAAELVAEMLEKANTPDTSPPRSDHDRQMTEAPKESARRYVQMRNERTESSGRTMSVSLDPDDNLEVSGDSYHPDPMPGSDSGDHEWGYKIRHSDLPELIGLLGGNPGDDIIDLLAQNFTGSRADEFERVVRDSGIEQVDYWCWP